VLEIGDLKTAAAIIRMRPFTCLTILVRHGDLRLSGTENGKKEQKSVFFHQNQKKLPALIEKFLTFATLNFVLVTKLK
jgi:hypothetical protein